jgi:hypothetical protein
VSIPYDRSEAVPKPFPDVPKTFLRCSEAHRDCFGEESNVVANGRGPRSHGGRLLTPCSCPYRTRVLRAGRYPDMRARWAPFRHGSA